MPYRKGSRRKCPCKYLKCNGYFSQSVRYQQYSGTLRSEHRKYITAANVKHCDEKSVFLRSSSVTRMMKKPESNDWVLSGFRNSGDCQTGNLVSTSTSPSPTSPRHVRGGAESLSPRIENQRHALATSEDVGLGEGLSMESNSSVEACNDVVKRSGTKLIDDAYNTRSNGSKHDIDKLSPHGVAELPKKLVRTLVPRAAVLCRNTETAGKWVLRISRVFREHKKKPAITA